ncbi:MAG: T9SS type A sorting domain-containing protein [Ignavibacteriales bacterium]|nr:T9SS type A sorting domain-containing protein [Ignavibacteriales bacterium]
MHKIFFIAALFLLAFANLFSQITINSSDIDTAIGYSKMFKWSDTIAVNLGSSGENQVWDFSSMNLTRTQSQTVVEKNSTSFGNIFPTSNYALKVINQQQHDTSYEFYQMTASNFLYTGFVEKYQTNFNIAKYFPEFSLVNFPLNYNQSWNSTSKIKIAPFYASTNLDSVIINVKVKFKTDGWGKLVTSSSSDSFNVLRLQHFDTLTIVGYRFGLVLYRDTLRTINYLFLSNNLGIIGEVASLDGETNPNFTTAVSFRLYDGIPVGVKENNYSLPSIFSLAQNYPNPFNPKTSVSFVITHSSLVNLKVYDILGNEVASLLNNVPLEVGEHSVSFNGSHLSSGIYFYRLTINDENGMSQSFVRTMSLVK